MSRLHAAATLGFVPAVAHFTPQLVYVDLYALDPSTGTMRRKKYKLNRISSASQRRATARDLVEKLNQRLRQGWNPWVHQEAPKALHTLREAAALYVRNKEASVSRKSAQSYRNQTAMFMAWCEREGLADIPVGSFNRQHAYRYMDYIRDERKVNGNTYNNYHLFCSMFWNWMVEREYRRESPFKTVKRTRREEKLRTLIMPAERQRVFEWFQQNDPGMIPVCLFTFHTLLRPRSEVLRMRIRHIDLEAGLITMPGEGTKSRRNRTSAIPPSMVSAIEAMQLHRFNPDDYVVGKGLQPGPLPCGYNMVGNRWNAMRKQVRLGVDKQLYSLRDSGIVQLIIDGVDLYTVMKQADHRNIETTNRYVQHYFPERLAEIKAKASSFTGKS